jgi:GTP-binding protein
LGRNGVPFAIIFTKLDKLSAKQWGERLEAYKSRLSEDWEELPPMMATSSAGRVGRDEVLGFIEGINENLQKQ